jgi:hypothetical protein
MAGPEKIKEIPSGHPGANTIGRNALRAFMTLVIIARRSRCVFFGAIIKHYCIGNHFV